MGLHKSHVLRNLAALLPSLVCLLLLQLFVVSAKPDYSDEQLQEMFLMPASSLISRMEQLFNRIDTDLSKSLTAEELLNWAKLIQRKMHEKDGKMEVDIIDMNKDGVVSLEEYMSASEESAYAERRFRSADKNKDGVLSVQEVTTLIHTADDPELLETEVALVFELQDKDKNNLISFEEFIFHDNATELSPAETDQMKTEFALYDVDGDKNLDPTEVKKVLISGEPDIAAEVNKMMENAANGVITEQMWKDDYQKYIVSVATDNGEILRFPEDYDANLPFKNVKRKESDDGGDNLHEEL